MPTDRFNCDHDILYLEKKTDDFGAVKRCPKKGGKTMFEISFEKDGKIFTARIKADNSKMARLSAKKAKLGKVLGVRLIGSQRSGINE